MTNPIFSPASLKALSDVVTGGPGVGNSAGPIGIYRTAGAIEGLMMECNLTFQVGTGARVGTTQEFLRRLVQTDPQANDKITRLIVRVCEPYDYTSDPERQEAVVNHLNRFLTHDRMEVVLQAGRPQLVEVCRSGAVVGAVSAKASTIDFDTVQRDIKRALDSAERDPEDAITAACSTIESVCRSILVELGQPLPAKKDVEGLMKAVQEPLGLSPTRTDLPAEIASDIRQVLSGLTTTVKGIGALRTHAGDAHGRERGFKRVDGRIARLAIHTASTAALFLIETWQRKYSRPLPEVSDGKA